ncbi:MFS transporter [Haloarcula nitratireducens]|uniref:MFS transporter n=1 Tax=Haloarcula nitratireducens TaxID=2487749 RepID=A0AAW4P7Y9_9EURY|nr:MFS transporter [Halomicroarcula nitratireducens]MBX0293713.1 MFS transporter [Halomicroarcula nitratireducens]
MADTDSTSSAADADEDPDRESASATDGSDAASAGEEGLGESPDTEALRRQVEEKYDFDDFGPEDMAEMTAEEWDVAFDDESWITGDELLDRVARDLRNRVANRDVFARIERHREPPRVLAYSDEGYAVVYPDGSVEGEGTVLRDVKPTIALASMDSYEVPETVPENPLPDPEAVAEGGGELGNLMLQVIAGAQLLAGVALLIGGVLAVAGVLGGPGTNVVALFVAGLAFIGIALVLFFTVANARLSDKFRAEEYRDRLRAVGLEDGERPDFVPELDPQGGRDQTEREESDEAGA